MIGVGMVDSLTDISEYHYYHYYWEGSVMRLLCKTPNSKKIDYCSWSVDSKKVIESSGYSPSPNQRQIYQLFGDFAKGECGIIVVDLFIKNSFKKKNNNWFRGVKFFLGFWLTGNSFLAGFRRMEVSNVLDGAERILRFWLRRLQYYYRVQWVELNLIRVNPLN